GGVQRLASLYDLLATLSDMVFASYGAWQDWRTWPQPVVLVQALGMSGALLVGKWVLLRRPFRTPVGQLAVPVLRFLFVLPGLLSWIVFARTYYSRAFLLISFALLFAWQVLDALVVRAGNRLPRLAAVPSALTERLVANSGLDIRLLPEPKVDSPIDGI